MSPLLFGKSCVCEAMVWKIQWLLMWFITLYKIMVRGKEFTWEMWELSQCGNSLLWLTLYMVFGRASKCYVSYIVTWTFTPWSEYHTNILDWAKIQMGFTWSGEKSLKWTGSGVSRSEKSQEIKFWVREIWELSKNSGKMQEITILYGKFKLILFKNCNRKMSTEGCYVDLKTPHLQICFCYIGQGNTAWNQGRIISWTAWEPCR